MSSVIRGAILILLEGPSEPSGGSCTNTGSENSALHLLMFYTIDFSVVLLIYILSVSSFG
jgi:hypothetical protein